MQIVEEINSTPEAGRELDSLIAEKLFGHRWWRSSENGKRVLFQPEAKMEWFGVLADMTEEVWTYDNLTTPHYSTNIAAAYEMEEKIKELGLHFQYVVELSKIINTRVEQEPNMPIRMEDVIAHQNKYVFDLIHASPVDRCCAALAATDER